VMRPNAGTDTGLPYDQFTSFAISPWGDAGLAEDKAVVRGTDVSLFQDKPDSRVYFELAKPYEVSRWSVDPCGHRGIGVVVAGAAGAMMTRKFSYQYERGWVAERVEPVTGLKQMIFTTTRPSPQGRSWSVNESGWLEWPTQIEGRQATIENQLKTAGAREYLFRRVHQPRVLQQNPYLQGVTNCWTAWTSTELNEDGKPLFDGETILDG